MNNWNQGNYSMQQGMRTPNVNVMPNPPLLPLPTTMYPMSDVPPVNLPPSVSMQLLNQAPLPDTTNQEEENENSGVTESNETSSRNHDRKRSSRDRAKNSHRRDRDRDRSNRRSRDRETNRSNRHNRHDRSKPQPQQERQTHWNDKGSEFPGSSDSAGGDMQANMMISPVMGSYHPQNMMPNAMMPNMMQNMTNNMLMQHQPMDQNQMSMMVQMNMMNNMMDQNMMMNQQMMSMMPNQVIYISTGVVLPPMPDAETPARREKPRGCRTVFVGGLPKGVSLDVLSEIFQRFGTIHDIKSPRNGVHYVRFQNPQSVEQSIVLSGYRFKLHNQVESEATTIFVDYALNRDDQNEFERQQRNREPTPPRVEPFSATALSNLMEKIKKEEEFSNFAPTLAAWLERGECNKKNANTFYSLVQSSNNQIRRLFNEKMQIDDEFQTLKSSFREKFAHVLHQLEQVAKILSVAKHQRVSDHFTKQQRRNIDMWLKMTEEVENIKEEFQTLFDEEETEKAGKNVVPMEKYEELKMENENLTYELEGYKNEAHLAKDEAVRKFEKFKAHFIAQQALQNNFQAFPPLPKDSATKPPPLVSTAEARSSSAPVSPSEAKLISILTAFLMVHPLGASIDYLTSYVKSLISNVALVDVQIVLQKYNDVFQCKVSGVGASIDQRWTFSTFDTIKSLQEKQ